MAAKVPVPRSIAHFQREEAQLVRGGAVRLRIHHRTHGRALVKLELHTDGGVRQGITTGIAGHALVVEGFRGLGQQAWLRAAGRSVARMVMSVGVQGRCQRGSGHFTKQREMSPATIVGSNDGVWSAALATFRTSWSPTRVGTDQGLQLFKRTVLASSCSVGPRCRSSTGRSRLQFHGMTSRNIGLIVHLTQIVDVTHARWCSPCRAPAPPAPGR